MLVYWTIPISYWYRFHRACRGKWKIQAVSRKPVRSGTASFQAKALA
ncbi:MAG: hypothetical protein ACR2NN_27070 [Bryobacteraceae bacterium]